MQLTLTGNTPSKKNKKNIFYRNSKLVVLPNKQHQDWHTDASWQVKSWRNTLPERSKLPYKRCFIEITIYPSTRAKSDLTNKAESIMDLLVDNEILVDDNWFCVPELLLKFGEVDPKNPRAEIFINELT